MPPSQLKRLKASLREQGITGPQKSKKEKKNPKVSSADQRARKTAALANIRETSNPFDFKHLARPRKFEYFENKPQDGKKALGRPGVTKSQGEETRRKTLLPEMQRRNKVGGILDRRIGEDDPTMTLDDRMMARFEREQQRKRAGNVFDLEEADDEVELTHGGRSLNLDSNGEDYDAASVSGLSDGEQGGFLKRKRSRDDVEGEVQDGEVEENAPDRKKTKAEVMKEVIAKSKQHKYERQQQKEDDDELRDELDKDLPDVLALLGRHLGKKDQTPQSLAEKPTNDFGINPARAALLAGKTREEANKEYDSRVREALYEQKAKPTDRTMTEDEKTKKEADRLKELELQRQRRMRGEPESGNEAAQDDQDEVEASDYDDAADFGLGVKSTTAHTRPEGVDDEDDFLMMDDIIATDSEADIFSEDSAIASEADDTMMNDDDDDFLKDVLSNAEKSVKAVNGTPSIIPDAKTTKLAYTFTCPRSHAELLEVLKNVAIDDLPTAVQRIRLLHHAGLHEDNKHKLAEFACALVDHIKYLSDLKPIAPLTVIDEVIRHIHSLTKAYPTPVATHFRQHLKQLQNTNPTPGDLTILVAIGSIFPSSDWFHQVITPASTTMARYLGLTTPTSSKDIATGAFITGLCLHFQRFSKRYIPEIPRHIMLCLKSSYLTPALLDSCTRNLLTAADLWSGTVAFIEIFTNFLAPLKAHKQTVAVQRLTILLQSARLRRRPQLLHAHRPLPIKSSVPKFEESFDPNKHYDPDKERSDASKLRKEYKREKKGALRELRKDANFIAREKLREKREKDRAYEEKYRRLVAEIQGEEGREKNEYEREKRKRQKKG